jgi:hypothetical protein
MALNPAKKNKQLIALQRNIKKAIMAHQRQFQPDSIDPMATRGTENYGEAEVHGA